MRRKLHVALIYNSLRATVPDKPDDRGSTDDLRHMIRRMARAIRKLGHRVTVLPLADDLMRFQRRLSRLKPDVVFNQYDDVINGAIYEMRVAALVRLMGFPLTGSSALALGLCRHKYMAASLLQGARVPVPPDTRILETAAEVGRHRWHFPIIVHPAQEHAGIGLDRKSVTHSRNALRNKVAELLRTYGQPVLAQHFLPGREFNIGIIGGRRMRVLPFAEVNYSELPPDIPPIMSYAAKWLENTVEYNRTSVVCPAPVTPRLRKRITRVAINAFRAVGGWGYGRVDIRLDEKGRPYVLEVNCNASLEEEVALARSARVAGIRYPALLQLIMQFALERPPYDVDIPMLNGRCAPPAAQCAPTP